MVSRSPDRFTTLPKPLGTRRAGGIRNPQGGGICGRLLGGRRLATLLMFITDVNSLGQKTCEGLVLTNSFYWDLTDKTRAWTKRYVARMGTPPCMLHAGAYGAAARWLKAVKAANTLDSDAVAAKMKELPVSDFYHDNVRIEPNGRVEDKMYVWQVKPASEARYRWDYYKRVASMSGPDATMPLAESGCPLVHA